jgi:hypothetical protein
MWSTHRCRSVRPDQGRYLADHIASAELVSFDSDIHLICLSDVLDQLAGTVTDFLERVAPRSERSTARRRGDICMT